LRLYRTTLAGAAITFGTRDFANRAVQSINRKHQSVHGVLKASAGVFPAGTPYDANDPELKLWVLSTITDSMLLSYDLFVSELSMEDRQSYYNDSLKVADMFDIPRSMAPPTYGDFRIYLDRMMTNGEICVSDEAREIARALFAPTPSGTLLRIGSAVGIALLPARVREEFGFRGQAGETPWWQRLAPVCRKLRRFTPTVLCANPAATFSQLMGTEAN
jgi:uncharacterized protein (DUF2236 family)